MMPSEEQKKIEIWYGKAVLCQGCERRFYYTNFLQLNPKESGFHMTRGALIHDAMDYASTAKKNGDPVDVAVAKALLKIQENDRYKEILEEDKTLLMLKDAWDKISKENVVETEFVVEWNRPNANWLGLPDMIIKDDEGHWVGELKNTLQWGERLRSLYYRDLQPWLYLTILQNNPMYEDYWPLQGVKLVIATPPVVPRGQKEPRVIPVEKIRLTPQLKQYVEEFLLTSESKIQELEYRFNCGEYGRKDRTSCLTRTSECPYIPLCESSPGNHYFEEMKKQLFDIRDPKAHYEEKRLRKEELGNE